MKNEELDSKTQRLKDSTTQRLKDSKTHKRIHTFVFWYAVGSADNFFNFSNFFNSPKKH